MPARVGVLHSPLPVLVHIDDSVSDFTPKLIGFSCEHCYSDIHASRAVQLSPVVSSRALIRTVLTYSAVL